MPASPGAVSGKIVLGSDDAVKLSAAGESVILVRLETSPKKILQACMLQVGSLLQGRNDKSCCCCCKRMGRACITGANELRIDFRK